MSFFKKYKNKSDSELAAAIILKNEKAFEELIKRYQGLLFSFCLGLIKDSHEAQDMVQETFLRFYESVESLDPEKSIKSFLFMIARNRCIDILRKKKPCYSDNLPETKTGDDPHEEYLKSEQERNLYRAIDCLTDNEKEIVFFKYKSEMKYVEIADIINKSESSVESTLVRARKKIRKRLGEIEGDYN